MRTCWRQRRKKNSRTRKACEPCQTKAKPFSAAASVAQSATSCRMVRATCEDAAQEKIFRDQDKSRLATGSRFRPIGGRGLGQHLASSGWRSGSHALRYLQGHIGDAECGSQGRECRARRGLKPILGKNNMRFVQVALLLALTVCSQAEQTSHARELPSFEPSSCRASLIKRRWNRAGETQKGFVSYPRSSLLPLRPRVHQHGSLCGGSP